MPSLDDTFAELLEKVRQPEVLNPARSDPIFYFVYTPDRILELKRNFRHWTAKLRGEGFTVTRVSMSEMMWNLVEESGRWESWLAAEPDADPDQINEAIRDVLRSGNRFVEKIADRINKAEGDKSIVFLTEAELLHPYFRTRTIESNLHDRVKVPTVIFYPGSRSGQYGLRFLGFYPVDGNYRSTILGGG